jgi:hypothetical protein
MASLLSKDGMTAYYHGMTVDQGPIRNGGGTIRKSEKRQRRVVVSVRMTDAELAVVQAHARAAGLSIGAYMRSVALDRGSRNGESTPRPRVTPVATSARGEVRIGTVHVPQDYVATYIVEPQYGVIAN